MKRPNAFSTFIISCVSLAFGLDLAIPLHALAQTPVAKPSEAPIPDIPTLMKQVQAHQRELDKVRENYTFREAQQTDDLAFTVADFSARARGVSPSGIAMAPRSDSGSVARTVHYFRKVSGSRFWPGGIAYGGDWSVYPGRG